MAVTYSSGTSGRHTVIPRDMTTYSNQQYIDAKLKVPMFEWLSVDRALLLFPKASQANLMIAKAMAFQSELFNDLRYALEFEISADLTLKAMTDTEQRTRATVC